MRFDLPGYWPESLRYSTAHPGIALAVAVHDAKTGLVCGVQRIFITHEGAPILKSDVRPWAAGKDRKIKLSLGDIDGNAARFSCWPDPKGRWGLAEGPESALAAQQQYAFPVWAAIHAGNMAKIDPPHWARRAFIFTDHDDAGKNAAAQTFDRLKPLIPTKALLIDRPGADQADFLIQGSVHE
jgi:putative DNA primase/helicase